MELTLNNKISYNLYINMTVGSVPILILDLDETIIGDIEYLSNVYYINYLLKFYKIKNNKKNINISELYTEKNKIIRPHFINFIQTIKKLIPSILIYIYTASTKDWATKEIQWIEKNCDIKFDRPIFTRNDCDIKNGAYTKSVKHIFTIIKKKHKNISLNNIFVIDDNDVFVDTKILLCPHYKLLHFVDLWNCIPKNATKKEYMYIYIIKLIRDNKLNPCSSNFTYISGQEDKICYYYKWLSEKYKEIHLHNKKYNNDNFWEICIDLLLKYNIQTFEKDNINFNRFLRKLKNNIKN